MNSVSSQKVQIRFPRILNQPSTHGPHGRLRSVVDVQLAKDVLDVLFDRFDTDLEQLANFAVR